MALVKQPITLPSRGILYDGKIPEGLVQIRQMSVDEIAAIESTGLQAIERIDRVITSCVELPNQFKHADLLITDGFAAILALRTLTFGALYNYTFRCRHCGKTSTAHTNIAEELEQFNAPDDLREPLSLELKDAGAQVTLRFLRRSDEARIANNARRMQLASNDMNDPSGKIRLALQLVSVNGEDYKDYDKRWKYVSALSAGDAQRWANFIDDKEPGLDSRVFPVCKSCGADNSIQLPFDAEFFRPTSL